MNHFKNVEEMIEDVLNQVTGNGYSLLLKKAQQLYQLLEEITTYGDPDGFQVFNEYLDVLEHIVCLRSFFYYQEGFLHSAKEGTISTKE